MYSTETHADRHSQKHMNTPINTDRYMYKVRQTHRWWNGVGRRKERGKQQLLAQLTTAGEPPVGNGLLVPAGPPPTSGVLVRGGTIPTG